MWLPSWLRGVAVILAVIAAGFVFAVITGGSDDADGAAGKPAAARDLLLRLHDLPPGYVNYAGPREGDDREEPLCSRLTKPADTPAELASVIEQFRPGGCLAVYARLYTVPGIAPTAAIVGTGAMRLQNGDAVDAAWKQVPMMLGRLGGDLPPHRVAKSTPNVGEETVLLHAPVAPFPLNYFGKKASYLVWHLGTTLATVLAVTDSYATSDQVVADLAPRQQKHVLEPTPYTKAERYDGEVGLGDPAIPFPVYWLGRKFQPGGGLPSNELFDSYYVAKPRPESKEDGIEEGPGAQLKISYDNVWLETWTPQTWHVFADSKAGHAITSWKCTQTRTVALPEGTATVFGGYRKDFKRCPKGAPQAFTAWVDVGGVKAVVNPPFAADFIETVNPYGSFAGMEAIVRALKVRPKPLY